MRITRHIGFTLLLAAFAAPAQASSIHKWVDADGITHYSDTPPTARAIEFELIDLPEVAVGTAGRGDDYYSIANQWQRMHRERIELERARAVQESARNAAPRDPDTIVIEVPESRPSVAILPRHRPSPITPKPAKIPPRRHPFAIPGRDWPVGLHPGRMNLRGGFESN